MSNVLRENVRLILRNVLTGSLLITLFSISNAQTIDKFVKSMKFAPDQLSALPSKEVVKASKEAPRLRIEGNVLRFIGAAPAAYFPLTVQDATSPELTAREFIYEQSAVLGVTSTATGFQLEKILSDKTGRHWVRFQQTYDNIPVYGAEILIQLGPNNGIQSFNNTLMTSTGILDGGKVSTAPTIGMGTAQGLAMLAMMDEKVEKPTASEPSLLIYDPSRIGNPGSIRLVWQTIVQSEVQSDVKELVFVDAHTGEIANHYSLIETAKSRAIYDSNETTADPGTLSRSEGQAATTISDVDNCYDFLSDTYDFYFSHFGRDSVNNAGLQLSATVRFCSGSSCPYANAYWDGSRIHFGLGFAAGEDVVAHETSHGFTQYTSALIYQNESGAINESMSDCFGEWVDIQYNPNGNNPATKWKIGEDLTGIGPFRDMKNPPANGHPDRYNSPNWYTGTGDNGGVHRNSGVNNKLCYLLTDGDTFNGYTITGFGLNKAAQLYYDVQTHTLSSSSNYASLHSAMIQSAVNLGWSSADKQNLENACLAVEISVPANLNPKVIRISKSGNDSNDGSTWALAKLTIGAASTASLNQDTLWVGAGTYTEHVTLKAGVSMYGGFAGTETSRSQRTAIHTTHASIIDGSGTGSCVTCSGGGTGITVLDGFTMQNGGGGNGAGINVGGSSTTISNNIINNNNGGTGDGAGLYLNGSSSLIINNVITNNTGNTATNGLWGGGISVEGNSTATIVSNVISGNSSNLGGGIYCRDTSSATIVNNVISNNTAQLGGGIYDTGGATKILNDTIVYNTGTDATTFSGGIRLRAGTPLVANNIIAFNSSGMAAYAMPAGTLANNCVFNTGTNYSGAAGFGASTGDINSDPKLVSGSTGNYQLLSTSPCINAGSNSYVPSGITTDLLGNARIVGPKVDMGAYEFAAASTATFTGTVSLQGWTGASLPTVQVKLDGGSASTVTLTSTGVNSGTFTLTIPNSGSHVINVKSSRFLSKSATVTPSGGTASASFTNLVPGDSNNDNIIDDSDLLAVINNFLSTTFPAADFNGDGIVDDTDLLDVINNFLQSGS